MLLLTKHTQISNIAVSKNIFNFITVDVHFYF